MWSEIRLWHFIGEPVTHLGIFVKQFHFLIRSVICMHAEILYTSLFLTMHNSWKSKFLTKRISPRFFVYVYVRGKKVCVRVVGGEQNL